jgi:hypothetical protein
VAAMPSAGRIRTAASAPAGVHDRGRLIENRALDTETQNLPSTYDLPTPGGGSITFTLSCAQTAACPEPGSPVSVEVTGVAILVSDTGTPWGGVSRNSPVDGRSSWTASAHETGVGLDRAELVIAAAPGGTPVFTQSVLFGRCTDMSPADATRMDCRRTPPAARRLGTRRST